MKQTLIEIVGVILRRLQERPETVPSEKGLRSWLAGQGFDKRDIDAALKLVRPQFGTVGAASSPSPTTVRLLSVPEQYKLTQEARNALVRLELYGMLDVYEREMILDYLHHHEGIVGVDELDYILSWMICSGRDAGSQQTLLNVLEGRPDSLH